jgi:hypothetical protein
MNRRVFLNAAIGAVFCIGANAASISDLVGTDDVYQVARDGRDLYVLDCRADQSRKVCTAPTTLDWNGGPNKNATKICSMAGNRAYVVDWDGSNMQPVTPSGTDNGHFWGDEWIVYTGEKENKSGAGTTWKVRIDGATNKPIESTRVKIANGQYSGAMNGSGEFLAESYGKAYMYQISTGTKSPPFNDSQNCVGSPHPGNKPQMMFNRDPGHKAMVIGEWNVSANTTRIIWTYSGTEVFGEWSANHENFCIINGKLVRISDKRSASLNMTIGRVGGPWVGRRQATSANISAPMQLSVREHSPQPGSAIFDVLGRAGAGFGAATRRLVAAPTVVVHPGKGASVKLPVAVAPAEW